MDVANNAVVYTTSIDNEVRIISYAARNKEVADIQVTNSRNKPLIVMELRAESYSGTAAGEKFSGGLGKTLNFPAKVDGKAYWLLMQHLVDHPGLTPWEMHSRLAAEDKEYADYANGQSFTTPGLLLNLIRSAMGFPPRRGGDDSDSCDGGGETQCTYTDINLDVHTLTYNCACGTPVCEVQALTAEVPVAVMTDSGEPEIDMRIVPYSQCVCRCETQGEFVDN